MPNDRGRQLTAMMRQMTAPGDPFEIGLLEHGGRRQRAFTRVEDTLPELFERCCARWGDAEFLIDGDTRLTFAETAALAQRVAAGLLARHGVVPGDRIGIAARNSAGWVIAYMGVLMAGGCATLLNGWWTSDELAGGVALAECRLVLADTQRAARLADLPQPPRTVEFQHDHPALGLSALFADDAPLPPLPRLASHSPATLVFTSGSTGTAKAALSDHRALVQVTSAFAVHAEAARRLPRPGGAIQPDRQTAIATVPLFHVIGEVALLLASFPLGRRLVLMPQWNAEEVMALIERERVTLLAGVPLMGLEVATHPERERYDLSSCGMFVSGGAPRPARHLAPLVAGLPNALHVMGYGLTETNCIGTCDIDTGSDARPGSSGPASSELVEVAVLGPDGQMQPPRLRGEIAVRTICAFREYWRNPEETAAALRPDGWFLTGDIGYKDEDGFLFVVDRKKDIIIRGGENISSQEVEQAIYAHPHVAEASVFGLPHGRYGEVPVAVYSIKDGHLLSEDELRAHLAGRIAHFKVPVRLWREEAGLPRLGTQKIDKQSLKARYSEGWEPAKSAS